MGNRVFVICPKFATHYIAGLAKVRVIKKVKDFSAQLQAKTLGKFRSLGDRNVSVIERRTDNQVSAQIAKARDRSKDGSVEPGINLAGY